MKISESKISGLLLKINKISGELVIILTGLLAMQYSTYCGLILTDDSINYILAAETFLDSGQLINSDHTTFSSWPPLFSIVIAFFSSFNSSGTEYLQIMVFLINGVLLVVLSKLFMDNKRDRILFLILSSLSVSLLMIHTFLWSEALFLVLFLFFIFQTIKVSEKQSLINVVLFIVAANLMCLQRHAGIFMLTGAIIYLVFFSDLRFLNSVILFLIGSAGFFIWNTYSSYIFSDGHHFLSHQYFDGFLKNVFNLLDVISAWFFPRVISAYFRVGFFLTVILLILSKTSIRDLRKDNRMILLLILIAVYIVSLVSIGRLDYFEIERYLSVIFPLAMVLVICNIWKLTSMVKKRHILIILIGLWSIYSVSRCLKNVLDWHRRSCQTEKIESILNNKPILALKNA